METKKIIKDFIVDNITYFEDDIILNDSDNIFELGFVNSLFSMALLNFVESTFDIQISDEELTLENFSSVDNIVSLVNRK
jgi:acyl carrier protein